jgi:hypothetical protein
MELLFTWNRSMVFSDLSQVTSKSIVTIKCRTTIK